MIISIPVDINLLLNRMRHYVWPRPECCPDCKNPKLWGHGFVDSFFDFSKKAIPLKRFRCSNCGCVIKLRPRGYFKRFQASIDTICTSTGSLFFKGKAIEGPSRQRQRHWFVALKHKAAAFGFTSDLMLAFAQLIDNGIIPVSRVI